MDPLSIAAASVGLVTFCGQIVGTLSQFVDDSKRVDGTVKTFSDEIASLAGVLNSIAVTFRDPLIASLTALTGHEGQHWRDVQRSLGDCRHSLGRLAIILERIKASEYDILRRARKQFKLNMSSGEIEVLRRQILWFTQTMQISFQMINM
jgi:Fungal N-terminal domain of STAND proteins